MLRTRLGLALVLLASCTTPAPAPQAVRPDRVTVTRELLGAVRDEIHATYDLRLLAAAKSSPDAALLAVAESTEEKARDKLVAALEAAGSKEARSAAPERLRGLLPIVRAALEHTGR